MRVTDSMVIVERYKKDNGNFIVGFVFYGKLFQKFKHTTILTRQDYFSCSKMSYGGFEYNQSNQPAAGGFGGFDAMSGGGGFMDSGGAAKQDSGKKPRGDRSIIPLTIKQVHEASNSPEGGFFIDNAQVNQVRVMGIIENMDDLSTAVNYQVNDGTGTCECKFWKDNDDGSNKHASIRYIMYCLSVCLSYVLCLLQTIRLCAHRRTVARLRGKEARIGLCDEESRRLE